MVAPIGSIDWGEVRGMFEKLMVCDRGVIYHVIIVFYLFHYNRCVNDACMPLFIYNIFK